MRNIVNGQIWKQEKFPSCEVMVLLTPFYNKNTGSYFCLLDVGCLNTSPLITDGGGDNGCLYSNQALKDHFKRYKYTYAGEGVVICKFAGRLKSKL